MSSEGFLTDEEWPVDMGEGSNSITQSTISQSIPYVKRGRGRPKKVKRQNIYKKGSTNSLPNGVYENSSGNYQVRLWYQGSNHSIGTFQTLEQATLSNKIARNIFKKDKWLRLSPEECERNIKLAKEAAMADAPDNEMCSDQTPPANLPVRDLEVNDCHDNLEGGVSTHGRKRKLSRRMADALEPEAEKKETIDRPLKKRQRKCPTAQARAKDRNGVTKGKGLCSVAGCTKTVQQGGVCCRHGAKTTRALCSYKGTDEGFNGFSRGVGADGQCPNVAKRGGLCRRHGAFDLPDCRDPLCKRVALKDDDYCTLHTKRDIDTARKLPQGVYENSSGNYQVRVWYQSSQQSSIGTFQTLEQATLASEIAWNMLKKDKGLQLSTEECERNIKLAKEAAWADSSCVKRGGGRPMKAKQTAKRAALKGVSDWSTKEEEKDYCI